MFKLFSQLPKSDADFERHIYALRKMVNQAEHQKIFDHLYASLSILDSKSSSLLGFNSIIIAVFALFLTQGGELGRFGGISLGVGMASVIISCFFLLSVVWVQWSATDELSDPRRHEIDLLKVRKSRTLKYRLAWYFAKTSVISLSVFLVRKIFTIMHS